MLLTKKAAMTKSIAALTLIIMQNKTAILIFTKNPELGKVKTRLAKTIGNEKALDIYKKLLNHTQQIVATLKVDKYLFYSDKIANNDQWSEDEYYKKLQSGKDLGERMENAFQELLHLGYDAVCIIGSDCYELNTSIIEEAFSRLKSNDFVIGPTYDGGYYLLGMRKFTKSIFQNKTWSTESVYNDTIFDFKELKASYYNLQKLSDIDEEKDLPLHWK